MHHRLIDILFITLCASIAGADDLSAVAEFAKTNEPWFSPQLDLGQGVPSESTFRTVFMLLDGEELVKYFVPWVQELTDTTTQIPQAWRFKVEGHELWTLADIERVKC